MWSGNNSTRKPLSSPLHPKPSPTGTGIQSPKRVEDVFTLLSIRKNTLPLRFEKSDW